MSSVVVAVVAAFQLHDALTPVIAPVATAVSIVSETLGPQF